MGSLSNSDHMPFPNKSSLYKHFVYQKALIRTFHTSFLLHNNLCEFTALEHNFKR